MADHNTIKRCNYCKADKPLDQFYVAESQAQRASPYCIECNAKAVLRSRYRSEIRRDGLKAFTERIKAKERQLGIMLNAAAEYSAKEGHL